MRKHLLGLMLLAGLAGCSSEQDPDGRGASLPAAGADAMSNAVPTAASLAAVRGSAASFASLPDRGELLAYDKDRKPRKSGAYSYYPVSLSEAHALNAIAKDDMVVPLPDGEALRLAYQTHEEQPDGNWTWIGRDDDGSTAVLTFGDKAVFGMISSGGDYYRVRTDRSGAWVVATDPSLVAAGGGRREDGHDYLLPGESGILTAAASKRLAKAASTGVSTKAAAVVDVVVGYSNGLAAAYGGSSPAATFVTALVSITNQAYGKSGVNMRLRLVHSLQVNFADTSDNQDALQQLTGYDADAQEPIAVNSAFNALRDARDEYGADLVAFVRAYREPEQDGCGIAWLLGMNQSAITAADDAEFAYAVIGAGEDTDESDNNTYFCSDYSLAHELGHLMGQAHNQEDANAGGAHTYSYGYRESSASGFFTIMAYPSGDAQVEIPYFANPAIDFANGRPTGVANQSDNARSMNITMPIIANFRATVVPQVDAPFDFTGDGRSELAWWNSSARQFSYTLINGSALGTSRTFNYSPNWTVDAVGDFNGDGVSDLISVNSTTREYQIGRSNGTGFSWSRVGFHSEGWQVIGAGDINNDTRDDILWWKPSTRQFSYSLMNGASIISTRTFPAYSAGYSVGAFGDFNGDGRLDLISANPSTRQYFYGRGTSSDFVWTRIGTYSAGWEIIGGGDINGDGSADILWWNASSRRFSYSLMNGASIRATKTFAPYSSGYTVDAFGDFDGDGRLDLISANASSRDYYVGLSTGSETEADFTWTRLGRYSDAAWDILLLN